MALKCSSAAITMVKNKKCLQGSYTMSSSGQKSRTFWGFSGACAHARVTRQHQKQINESFTKLILWAISYSVCIWTDKVKKSEH